MSIRSCRIEALVVALATLAFALVARGGFRFPAAGGAVVSAGLYCAGLSLAWLSLQDPAVASEIAILKSADIAAYTQAVAGIRADVSDTTTTITEYDMQGDVGRGRKLARKIRASEASLVIAVGLKAALVAKLE